MAPAASGKGPRALAPRCAPGLLLLLLAALPHVAVGRPSPLASAVDGPSGPDPTPTTAAAAGTQTQAAASDAGSSSPGAVAAATTDAPQGASYIKQLLGSAPGGASSSSSDGVGGASGGGGGVPPQVPVEPRVLGGQLPTLKQPEGAAMYGWLAALLYPTLRGPWFACGGTLIKPNVVLTAGHCVIDADGSPRLPGTVKLGWPDLADATPPAGAEVLPVARVVPHPAFAARPSPATASDLALLVLGQNSTRAPVALPPPGTRLPDRQRVWAAGYSGPGASYGRTANGFFTEAFTSETCAARWVQWGKAAAYGEWTDVPATTICTGGQDDAAGVCNGDSGGPLVYGETAPHVLVGVLSWGTGPSPCAPGTFEVNAWASLLAPAHQAWLAQELALLGHSYP